MTTCQLSLLCNIWSGVRVCLSQLTVSKYTVCFVLAEHRMRMMKAAHSNTSWYAHILYITAYLLCPECQAWHRLVVINSYQSTEPALEHEGTVMISKSITLQAMIQFVLLQFH